VDRVSSNLMTTYYGLFYKMSDGSFLPPLVNGNDFIHDRHDTIVTALKAKQAYATFMATEGWVVCKVTIDET